MSHTKIDNILVVKVGTSTLTTKAANGDICLDQTSFHRLGQQLIDLQRAGYHLVLVSSAAITAGMLETGLHARPSTETDMPNLQRLASIGWRLILNSWDTATGALTLGELLLTRQELDSDDARTEALRVMYELMRHGDIPVINENDAIAHEEIAFGDNDTLAAVVAAKVKRSPLFGDNISLIVLSDIHGVYADITDEQSLLREITDIPALQHLAKHSTGTLGTGGMITKFTAATIATRQGVETYITHGRAEQTISRALAKEIGTHFRAQ